MSLGDRMKSYEAAAVFRLPPRMPVIIRVDGKAFHTWARNCQAPFDPSLMAAMDAAALKLCEVVQTTVAAFVQSDEISLVLHTYRRYETQPWFANALHKLCSVSASVAAAVVSMTNVPGTEGPAFFDARAFVLPEHEVANYLLWRQQDAERNSVQMLARSLFSHSECHRKSCAALRGMCTKAGSSWEELNSHLRLGRLALRQTYEVNVDGESVTRSRWAIQPETPRFSGRLARMLCRGLLATDDAAPEASS